MDPKKKTKREFIASYTDCIANAGAQNPSLSWWATWLSSKNRFLSSATPYFEEIYLGKKAQHAPPKGFRYGAALILALIQSMKFTLKMFFQITLIRIKSGSFITQIKKELLEKEVYLIKTFAYEHSFKGNKFRDVYFESLPEYLKTKGLSVLTIYDPIDCFKNALNFNSEHNLKSKTLPYQLFCYPQDLIIAWVLMIQGLFRAQFKNLIFSSRDVSSDLQRFYRLDLVGANALYSFLMYLAFRRIAKSFRLSHFLLTFENNPWERLCQIAIKKKNPKTKIIGYQHTVVPEASLNMFSGRKELEYAPSPDKILTVGAEPARILREYGHFNGVQPEPCCALRFQYLEKIFPKTTPVKKTLLIALEGVYEAIPMLNEALRQMRNVTDWKITVRTHPALPWKMIKSHLKIELDDCDHIQIDPHKQLTDDLNASDILLYWGSSVALEALKLGIPIIHFNTGQTVAYDPLFACSHLKWTVQPGDSLPELLDKITKIPLKELEKERAGGQEYIKNYFYPVTSEALEKFI